jgi:hypothetical protein
MVLTVTSGSFSTLVVLDNRKAYYGSAQVQPYTPDGAGNDVYIYDSTQKLQVQRIYVDLATDTVDVNGVTVFADAAALVDALAAAFFLSSVAGGPLNPNAAKLLFTAETVSLADGAEIDTGLLDFSAYAKQQLTIVADAAGLTFVQDLRPSETGEIQNVVLTLQDETNLTIPIRLSFQRLRIQNNTGQAVANVALQIKAYVGGDGATVAALSGGLVAQSQATLTRAVIAGSPAGTTGFQNVVVNSSGALLVSDYGTEVAQGKFSNVAIRTKSGRNSDIDTNTTPEDVWNGGGLYTGFNCTVAERLSFVSASALDVGSLVASGVATGGTTTALVDALATFITSGVAPGDLLINDTQTIHGVIASVDSETQLTAFDFSDGVAIDFTTGVADAYRIARATSTGAAVCKAFDMLDANYDSFEEYIILNGATAVLSGGSYLRQPSGRIILAGSFGSNQGEVTGRQSVTVANVTMVMPANSGETAIACDTVPRGKIFVMKNKAVQMARAGGTPGSAKAVFQTRKRGEAWQTKRPPEISEAQGYAPTTEGGLVATEFTDIKWSIESVSDNGTIVSAEFEYYIIDL